MTIRDLIDYLNQFDRDTLVFLTEEHAADALEPSEEGTDYVSLDLVLADTQ